MCYWVLINEFIVSAKQVNKHNFPPKDEPLTYSMFIYYIIKYDSKENYEFPKTCACKNNLVIIIVWKPSC